MISIHGEIISIHGETISTWWNDFDPGENESGWNETRLIWNQSLLNQSRLIWNQTRVIWNRPPQNFLNKILPVGPPSIIALAFLAINFLFASHNSYLEKPPIVFLKPNPRKMESISFESLK